MSEKIVHVNIDSSKLTKARQVAIAKNPSVSNNKEVVEYILEDYAKMHVVSVVEGKRK
jgi:sulfur carrier protein ThiS